MGKRHHFISNPNLNNKCASDSHCYSFIYKYKNAVMEIRNGKEPQHTPPYGSPPIYPPYVTSPLCSTSPSIPKRRWAIASVKSNPFFRPFKMGLSFLLKKIPIFLRGYPIFSKNGFRKNFFPENFHFNKKCSILL